MILSEVGQKTRIIEGIFTFLIIPVEKQWYNIQYNTKQSNSSKICL